MQNVDWLSTQMSDQTWSHCAELPYRWREAEVTSLLQITAITRPWLRVSGTVTLGFVCLCWPWRKHSCGNAKMETLNGDNGEPSGLFKWHFAFSLTKELSNQRLLQESISSNHFGPDSQLSRWDLWLLIKYSSLALVHRESISSYFRELMKSESLFRKKNPWKSSTSLYDNGLCAPPN